MGILSSIGSFISGSAGSMIDSGTSYLNTKKTNEANKDMLRMQMDYNSPSAQMKRYEEAGLNPYLAISGGNPGNIASIPEMKAPDTRMGLNFQAMKQMALQNSNLKSQEKLLQAQTSQAEVATNMNTLETLQRIDNMKSEISKRDVEIDKLKAEIKKIPYDTRSVEASTLLNALEKQIRERDFNLNKSYNRPSGREDSASRLVERKINGFYRTAFNTGHFLGNTAKTAYKKAFKIAVNGFGAVGSSSRTPVASSFFRDVRKDIKRR